MGHVSLDCEHIGDQIAMAQVIEAGLDMNGRRYFEYDMGSTRINKFFPFFRDLQRETRPMERREAGNLLSTGARVQPRQNDGCPKTGWTTTKRISVISISAIPVLAIPQYVNLAQSFPNTVPFAEGIGFHRTDKETG